MAHGHGQLIGIHQFFLERVFPETALCAVAAATIGQDKQVRRLAIALASFPAPPVDDRFHRELGRVMRSAHHDGAAIGLRIIKPAGARPLACERKS